MTEKTAQPIEAMAVPIPLFEAIANNLTAQPYGQVHQIIDAMKQCTPITVTEAPMTTTTKSAPRKLPEKLPEPAIAGAGNGRTPAKKPRR